MTDQSQAEIFLGRVEEQDRFREALRVVLRESNVVEKVKDWVAEKDPATLPFVFLLYGEGGMGKSRLARRLGDIALNDDVFKDRFRVIRLDWEKRKEIDFRLVARDSVSLETVFYHLYSIFRDEGFGREFDPYEKAVKDRAEAEKKVAQALDRTIEGGDRYAVLRDLGGKGLVWLVRSGLVGGAPIPVPQEPTAKVFESVIGGGAEALARARETATNLLRSTLNPDEFDLFTSPNETLARRLADGIRASASKKPIVFVLDTYEIADRADVWVRIVMKRVGPRVLWIVAGRDNLVDSRSKYGEGSFMGYRAEFSSDRLRAFPLGEFSVNDVADYFAWRAPERPLEVKAAEAIHHATLGIPLAVRESAAIWKTGVPLDDIVSDVPPRAAREAVVKVMSERFLLHCFNDPEHSKDKLWLYALALAHRPGPDLLAAMFESDDLERDLSGLERRYSFVFVDKMKLHNSVASFFGEYLLQDLRRKSKEVRGLNERAVAHLRARQAAREKTTPTLEARLADERWTSAILGLAHHGFWLDEDDGWAVLMPALVGAVAYDQGFARSLIETAEPFAATFTKVGQRRLEILQDGLGGRRSRGSKSPLEALEEILGNKGKQSGIEQEAVLLTELEASARSWLDDVCTDERRAILDLHQGQLLYRREKYTEALAMYEKAEQGLLKKGEALKKQLGEALYEPADKLLWPEGRDDVVYSSEAEYILPKVVAWLPENPGAWHMLGVVLRLSGKPAESIPAIQRAIELDPQGAYSHNGLGNAYSALGRHDEALAAYQRAIELDPKLATAHASLAACYRKLSREAEYANQIKVARELIAKENEYNQACFECICGNVDEALTLLKVALEKKQSSLEWVRRDPDFEFIRDDPRFKALVGEAGE